VENPLIQIGLIAVLGIGAQWVAWRLQFPAILLLLFAGLFAGPGMEMITGHRLLDPDKLLGDLVLPLVGLSVGIILFEGGLTLRFAELTQAGPVIRKLVTLGAAMTWIVATLSARWILELDWSLALLLGAILVVTGPTVVGPLLRFIRPRGQTAAILKWEGIVIDPIGAMLAVLVFEVIPSAKLKTAGATLVIGALKTTMIGSAIGLSGAFLLVLVMRRLWAPDFLQNPITLMLITAAVVAGNAIQHEAGLFAVTVMGIALANQKRVTVQHIREFKENLTVLLVSALFIILSSRLAVDQVRSIGSKRLLFTASLIVVARPACVLVSTLKSGLTRKEKLFLCCMAPRGIVAASVSSVFALRLADQPGAERFVPATFTVIIGTVIVYGLIARPVARVLGLASAVKGFLVAGANPVARAIAKALHDESMPVLVVDTSREQIGQARLAGLPVFYGSILSELLLERDELANVGRLLALTPNNEVNALAGLQFGRLFGREEVFQLASKQPAPTRDQAIHPELLGRVLFAPDATYEQIARRLEQGAKIKRTPLTPEFSYAQFQQRYANKALPLFVLGTTGDLHPITPDQQTAPRAGETVISLVDADAA
jgi:NhaP-type Na+/H+ or K+/H+ antiporter/Trk K+ transport system NAD-binding subunit